jgi:hypothetical protein
MRYLAGGFIFDFIATFPFYYINFSDDLQTLELLQLLKLLRLRKLLTTMNKSTFQNLVKQLFRWRLSRIIHNTNKITDPSTDHN